MIVKFCEEEGGHCPLEELYTYRDNSGSNCEGEKNYSYFVTYSPGKIYGGDTRVKAISTSDGYKSYKTVYDYSESGRSTGVTASLPSLYGINKRGILPLNTGELQEMPEGDDYWASYLGDERSFGRPAPGVLYSKVKVFNVDPDDEDNSPLNGITEYEFFTAKDYQYSYAETDLGTVNRAEINDPSGIYGKPKSITYFEEYSDAAGIVQFRPIKEDIFEYALSSELHGHGTVLDSDETEIDLPTKPLGIIQEKYKFENEYLEDSFKRSLVAKNFENVYATSTFSKEFYYDSPTSAQIQAH